MNLSGYSQFFIDACKVIGVKEICLFNPIDLYENKNMHKVLICIHTLATLVESKGVQGIDGAKEWVEKESAVSPQQERKDEV